METRGMSRCIRMIMCTTHKLSGLGFVKQVIWTLYFLLFLSHLFVRVMTFLFLSLVFLSLLSASFFCQVILFLFSFDTLAQLQMLFSWLLLLSTFRQEYVREEKLQRGISDKIMVTTTMMMMMLTRARKLTKPETDEYQHSQPDCGRCRQHY